MRQAQSRRVVVTVVSGALSDTPGRPKMVSGYDKLKRVVVALVEGGIIVGRRPVQGTAGRSSPKQKRLEMELGTGKFEDANE